jgi:hypothetical protein
LFSFFAFVGAQCHEQQGLPLKFADSWMATRFVKLYSERCPMTGHRMN